MKTWTKQLIESNKLFGWLISNNQKNETHQTLIEFKKEDINNKYGIYYDNIIPTIFKL